MRSSNNIRCFSYRARKTRTIEVTRVCNTRVCIEYRVMQVRLSGRNYLAPANLLSHREVLRARVLRYATIARPSESN